MAPEWSRLAATDRTYEISNLVASVFARYPYPESFFTWSADAAAGKPTFLNRPDRRPAWMGTPVRESRFPVVTEQNAGIGQLLLTRIQRDAKRHSRLSAFQIALDGMPYQVVAELYYSDVYREQLADVVGFTINLSWVREHYFRDLTAQVWNVSGSGEEGLAYGVVDAAGTQVVGPRLREGDQLTNTRRFDLDVFRSRPDGRPSFGLTSGAVESAGQRGRIVALSCDCRRQSHVSDRRGLGLCVDDRPRADGPG